MSTSRQQPIGFHDTRAVSSPAPSLARLLNAASHSDQRIDGSMPRIRPPFRLHPSAFILHPFPLLPPQRPLHLRGQAAADLVFFVDHGVGAGVAEFQQSDVMAATRGQEHPGRQVSDKLDDS